MIKVAIIIERANISLGGAERSIRELAGELNTQGVKTTIIAAKAETDSPNIIALCNDSSAKRTSGPVFAEAIKDHLRNNHYDIIHSTLPFDFADIYQPRGGSYLEAMIRNAASYNTMTALFKRVTHWTNLHRTAFIRAEKKLCKPDGKTRIAALSQYVKDQFVRNYKLDEQRITLIPNGIKVENNIDTAKAQRLREQILSLFRITDSTNPAIFLFAANNFRLKGLGPLLKAISRIAPNETQRPIYLVAAGSGKDARYRRFADHLGVSNRVAFIGAVNNIQTALSICDVAILPTYYDPCSRFILEAMAMAKPVITTSFNGAAERIVNNRHGIVIDRPDNMHALVEAMCHYADEQNCLQSTQAITNDNLIEQVSIKTHVTKLIDMYKTTLKDKGEK